jgi:hypothetical protein
VVQRMRHMAAVRRHDVRHKQYPSL